MKRSLFGGSFLIVEGSTDSRLYGKFTDRLECDVIAAYSKDNVRLAVKEVFLRRNDKKAIGIVDADTDRLRGITEKEPVFVTDCRDSETMMIRSEAFDHVLTEYGDRDRMDSFTETYGDIRDAVAAACYPLGLLMYMSERSDRGLSFRDLDHSLFTDKKGLRTDITKMVSAVVSNSLRTDCDVQGITAELRDEMGNGYGRWDVCRGHDMISVLAIGLREIFGGYNSRNIRPGELAGALRLAYTKEEFRATELFSDTAEWCSRKGMTVWSV